VFDSGERYAKANVAVKAARSLLLFGPDPGATGAKETPRFATGQTLSGWKLPFLRIKRVKNDLGMREFSSALRHPHREVEKRSVPNQRQTDTNHSDTIAATITKKFAMEVMTRVGNAAAFLRICCTRI
jgi:hypothetical protein